MKRLANKSFAVSFLIIVPFLLISSRSHLGNVVSYSNADTLLENREVKPEAAIPVRDSVLGLIYGMQKQFNTKLDTGLARQIKFMQSQNYLAMKFVEMDQTIHQLNKQLIQKTAVPAQIRKDAEKGNIQKEVWRMLLIILACCLVIIAFTVAIFVQTNKKHRHQYT